MVLTAKQFIEVAIESWSDWDLPTTTEFRSDTKTVWVIRSLYIHIWIYINYMYIYICIYIHIYISLSLVLYISLYIWWYLSLYICIYNDNTSSAHLQRNNFSSSKTSWRRLGRRRTVTLKMSWRPLEDMSWRCLEDVL